MKKNLIGIIAIAALVGSVASGCTYSRGKMVLADVSEGIESSSPQDQGPDPAGEIAEGNGDSVVSPSGTTEGGATEDGNSPADEDSGGSEAASGYRGVTSTPSYRSESVPPMVKSVELLNDYRTFIVTFTKPIDVQAAIQNQSIVVNDLSYLFPKTLKGTLFSSLLSSNVSFSAVVGFTLDESEKKLHVDTNLNIVPYQIEVYGVDSDDSSKAIKDKSGTAMMHEYQHMFICDTDWDTDQTTYVQGCPAISTN